MQKKELERAQNTNRIRQYFHNFLEKIQYEGVFGVANFRRVFHRLIPIQQTKLKTLCQERFNALMKQGSIISVGIAYHEPVIDCINVRNNGTIDKIRWNIYAREYQKLNRLLNEISSEIAIHFGGIPISATLEGLATTVKHVEDYYDRTISHRVVAEHAGLGWRGKNELIVNEKYSCALRFASIITGLPLLHSTNMKNLCGNCTACLEVCQFLKKKANLKNYRENCRKYINALDLEDEVCGKCIQACYRRSIFKDQFELKGEI